MDSKTWEQGLSLTLMSPGGPPCFALIEEVVLSLPLLKRNGGGSGKIGSERELEGEEGGEMLVRM